MGAISYFDEDTDGKVNGSSFGEPDGTQHKLAVVEGNRHLIIRVELQGSEDCVDLLLTEEQAKSFGSAVDAVLHRIGVKRHAPISSVESQNPERSGR